VLRHRDGADRTRRDVVAVEEPLEIRVSWEVDGVRAVVPVAVTMRTPGHDFDLAAGFLRTEGILGRTGQVSELTYCRGEDAQEYNIVEVRLRPGESVDPDLLTRNFYTSSSCGVCGKASLDAVEVRGCAPLPDGALRVPAPVVAGLPSRLRDTQRVFERTGGLHAAGLFSPDDLAAEAGEGTPLVREDVGRHNAVDKVVGRCFLDGRLPLADHVLVVSGRASFEILQKAVAAGIPAVVAVGAPSSLAVDLAVRFNVTLVGFARDGGFNAYAGEGRLA
jgi:FdhD protein